MSFKTLVILILMSFKFLALPVQSYAASELDISSLYPEGLINFSPKAFSDNALMVDKSKKKIYLFKVEDGLPKLKAQYDTDVGKNNGDKISLGDAKTPEGVYFFDRMIEAKDLDQERYGVLAFTTDYPNFFDKRVGKGGNGIWLHAIAEKTSLDRGSKGCVVVRNNTIKLLQPEIKLKYTPLMVYDQINWVTKDRFIRAQTELNKYVQNWKANWESKKLDDYISFYAPDFRFKNMNLTRYKKYKMYFAEHYSNISIKLSEPQIFEHNGDMIVRFLQDYSSPEHKDFGVKVLYLQSQSKTAWLKTIKNHGGITGIDTEKKLASAFSTVAQAAPLTNAPPREFVPDPTEYKIIGEFWEALPDEDRSKL